MDATQDWVAIQIYHQGRQPQVIEALGSESSAVNSMPSQLHKYYQHPINDNLDFPFDEYQQGYRNVLISVPKNNPYRPQMLHPKQRVLGSQTAIVTGAAGEEIYYDEYGRVKILFHWDRINPNNENSSHWVRVASNWAHDGYGTVVIPRVGMEVLVSFLEGDIDNPVISGAVHNGVNKVPYDLPANKTRSVFKTSSSKGGVGSNELRIEDKAGQEQILVQAERNYDQLTKNDHTVQVKNNSHLQVGNEHSETITGNRYTHNKAEEHHLTSLERKTQIMMNDHKTVGISEHETIGTVKTVQAGMEIHLKSGLQTVVDGGLSLTLKAGGHHIVLNPAGIWMTIPVLPIGVPMEGTPAMPLPPLNKEKIVETTVSPAVQAQRLALLSAQPVTEICTAQAYQMIDSETETDQNTEQVQSQSTATTDSNTETSSNATESSSSQEIIIHVSRQWNTTSSTISSFTIDGSDLTGYFLERPGPDTTASGQRLRIPQGEYKLEWHNSARLGRCPNLYNDQVPVTRRILIHAGNTAADSDGCLLAGTTRSENFVGASQSKLTEIRNYLNSVNIDDVKVIISNDY